MTTIPVIWTNDDISFGCAEKLIRQLEFLKRFDIPGSFFCVPFSNTPQSHGKTLADDAELLGVIDSARNQGHDFYQHGYRHTPFECGVPESWMLDFAPQVEAQFNEHRLEIEAQHTFDALVTMLEKGRRIWRQAFGEDSPGFRPGWASFCGNLYRALEALGYDWVTSRTNSPTSWLRNQGIWDAQPKFREAIPMQPGPAMPGLRLMEYPLNGGDYAFRIPNEPRRIDSMVDLAMEELEYVVAQNAPMMICSHYHGLEHADDSGYAIHEKLLPKMLDDSRLEFINMAELHERYRPEPDTEPHEPLTY